MEDQGMMFEKYDEEIVARIATEEESRLRQLPGSSPVLRVVRAAVADERPVEVCDTVMELPRWRSRTRRRRRPNRPA